jgi:hypothetical protein
MSKISLLTCSYCSGGADPFMVLLMRTLPRFQCCLTWLQLLQLLLGLTMTQVGPVLYMLLCCNFGHKVANATTN